MFDFWTTIFYRISSLTAQEYKCMYKIEKAYGKMRFPFTFLLQFNETNNCWQSFKCVQKLFFYIEFP